MTQATATERLEPLRQWSARQHGLPAESLSLTLAAGDASFRRYFRLTLPDGETRMLMDAPPEQEGDNTRRFVAIAREWRDAGLPVPAMYRADLETGFVELEDLGDSPLQQRLEGQDETTRLDGYRRALDLLLNLQRLAPSTTLPVYDAPLLGRELDLFPDCCLDGFLNMAPPPSWPTLRQRLIDDALDQPRVAVHRDFDAMNLMVGDDTLYLIDFQDAVAGPPVYDLISLLRGRYWRFDASHYREWIETYRQQAVQAGLPGADVDPETFRYRADSMAAQRSLKVLGIFCRLTFRDHKEGYLARMPCFLDHLRDSLSPWPEFAPFRDWLDAEFTPALQQALSRHGIDSEARP